MENIKKPNITKNDMHILDTIRKLKATNSLRGVPISSIVEKTKLSHTKIRSTTRLLLEENLIEEGFMQKNAKTYYITEKGTEMICGLLVNAISTNQTDNDNSNEN